MIAKHIDENLKKVFEDYSSDEMPSEITDLLMLLRAQDDQKGQGDT